MFKGDFEIVAVVESRVPSAPSVRRWRSLFRERVRRNHVFCFFVSSPFVCFGKEEYCSLGRVDVNVAKEGIISFLFSTSQRLECASFRKCRREL